MAPKCVRLCASVYENEDELVSVMLSTSLGIWGYCAVSVAVCHNNFPRRIKSNKTCFQLEYRRRCSSQFYAFWNSKQNDGWSAAMTRQLPSRKSPNMFLQLKYFMFDCNQCDIIGINRSHTNCCSDEFQMFPSAFGFFIWIDCFCDALQKRSDQNIKWTTKNKTK